MPDRKGQEERIFKDMLVQEKLKIKEIPADGNCLFNSILHQLQYKKGIIHNLKSLRKETAEFLRKQECLYSAFITEISYKEYCDRIENTSEWGGELEVHSIRFCYFRFKQCRKCLNAP